MHLIIFEAAMLANQIYTNPFNQPYLTEGISDPHELLSYYSFQPFTYLRNRLGQPGNIFLVGRKGVGKTMLLRLFDANLVATLYREKSPVFKRIRTQIPVGMVGVYINLGSPAIRVREFSGRKLEASWWQRAFSDYLNCIIILELIKNLDLLSAEPEWLAASDLNGSPLENLEDVWSTLTLLLRQESRIYEDITNVSELRSLMEARIQGWIRFLNYESNEAPPTPLSFGLPVFQIIASIRTICPKFRLMVILDQYEIFHGLRDVVDFRPICNQAMSEAARGGTGVEFKIGTRAYAYQNLSLLVGGGRIESGREMAELNLDNLADKYYKAFVADIFEKRLKNSNSSSTTQKPMLASMRLLGLSPREEAQKYMKHAGSDTPRHLNPVIERWRAFGINDEESRTIIQRSALDRAHPLTATLVGIALTRWLRDGAKKAPLNIPAPEPLPDQRSALMIHYAIHAIDAVEYRYREGITKSRKMSSIYKAADDLVSAYEQVALFRIASSYKNQLRYYAGFDTLVRVSSNVALVFLQIMKTAYELLSLRQGQSQIDGIPPEIQSEAVYTVSEEWQTKIAREYDYGVAQDSFLRQLGSLFRNLQMDITTTIPAPNGFSVPADQFDQTNDSLTPRDNAASLIHELVGWGLLEEDLHQDKTKGRPPRRKFYLNRVLCPFFKLSDQHLKDPIYISNLEEFVASLRAGRIPHDLDSTMRASRGTLGDFNSNIATQPNLFD